MTRYFRSSACTWSRSDVFGLKGRNHSSPRQVFAAVGKDEHESFSPVRTVRTRHDPRVRVTLLRGRAYSTPPIPMLTLPTAAKTCRGLLWLRPFRPKISLRDNYFTALNTVSSPLTRLHLP